MEIAPLTASAVALVIAVTGCLACSDETRGNGGPDDAASGGEGGAGEGGGSGSSGAAGTAGSAGADSGTDAGDDEAAGTTDGSLDPTFGTNGIVLSGLEGSDSFQHLTFQSSGRIVVAGVLDSRAMIARYSSEGALDASFGNMGVAVVETGGTFSAFSKIVQQSDGSLIAAGLARNATFDMLVARFSADGELDRTFGTEGLTVLDAGGDDTATELIVLPDDTLLIGGWASPAATNMDFAVAHLAADGMPDATFGSAGLAFAHFDQADRVRGMGRDSQGRIVVGGEVSPDSDSVDKSVGFARFTATGVLDTSFGDQGWAVFPSAGATSDEMDALTVLSGGEILAAGLFDGELGLIRLTDTGEADVSFGELGRAHAGLGGGATALIREAGSTLIVGYNDTLAVIVKITDAGDLDASLEGDGVQTFDLGTGDSDRFFGAARQEDGKLVAVGWAEGGSMSIPPPLDGALVRFDLH